MNFNNLLPVKGQSVSDWQMPWLKSVIEDVAKIISVDNLDEMRNSNERLSSYMPTLSTLMASHEAHICRMRQSFESDNPRPGEGERGITAWKDREQAFIREAEANYNYLERLHSDIDKRLSTRQSALRTKSDEVKRL